MKIFLALLLTTVAVVAAAGYYAYDLLTYEPEWYAPGARDGARVESARTAEVYAGLEDDLRARREVKLDDEAIRAVVAQQVAQRLGLPADELVKGMHTSVGRWGASVEMVVDVRRLSSAAIPAKARQLVDEAIGMLPRQALESTFVKLEVPAGATPAASLAGTVLFVGGLRFSLADLRARLGLDAGQAGARLDALLARYQARFEMGEITLEP